ncbi:MAG: CCA tRNA nucleotidyltransferase [SAR202 cluster bacterium]|nr:CCA tRNA nucleotidyltransferase [SAR202 cluster bacterium]
MNLNNIIELINISKGKYNLEFYLIGGAVRDLLTGNEPTDLDFNFIGQKQSVEKFIKEIFAPKEIQTSQFHTYKFKYNSFDIDFAMCRKEKYSNPAALPEINEGNLLEDQQRRDFSINSIAINTDDFTQKKFIDPFNGILDIKAKQIKNIHSNSFSDDPTRIFRAIRYSKRLNFQIDSSTLNEIQIFKDNITNLSGIRIRNEIFKILEENQPIDTLLECEKFKLFKHLNIDLILPPYLPIWEKMDIPKIGVRYVAGLINDRNLIFTQNESLKDKMLLFLSTFLCESSDETINTISKDFGLEKSIVNNWVNIVKMKNDLDKFNFREDKNSKLHSILNKSTKSICLGLTQWYDKSKSIRIVNYWNKIRLIKPKLNTDDLFSIGISEGPILGKIKKELEIFAIDYPHSSEQEQREFVTKLNNS